MQNTHILIIGFHNHLFYTINEQTQKNAQKQAIHVCTLNAFRPIKQSMSL